LLYTKPFPQRKKKGTPCQRSFLTHRTAVANVGVRESFGTDSSSKYPRRAFASKKQFSLDLNTFIKTSRMLVAYILSKHNIGQFNWINQFEHFNFFISNIVCAQANRLFLKIENYST
jgi:hypothetical protein